MPWAITCPVVNDLFLRVLWTAGIFKGFIVIFGSRHFHSFSSGNRGRDVLVCFGLAYIGDLRVGSCRLKK